MNQDDDNFRLFAGNLEQAIERYGAIPDDDLLALQKRQFEELVSLETQFRQGLIRSGYGPEIYNAFIKKICDENGNILTSRPYFRERQDVCIGPISQALKKRHVRSLYKYSFNYNFVSFAIGAKKWRKNSRFATLATRIAAIRKEIIEMNMPLAISQARIFWQKAPVKLQDNRFTFMDFVQIAADGLMSAVDKFVLPFDRVWRAVAIGRMKGNFIETFNETTLHFFPLDKRKIYRANKHLKSFDGAVDFERLADLVNTDVEGAHKTNAEELANLMAASARTSSADAAEGPDESSATILDRCAAPEEQQPDVQFEHAEALNVMRVAMRQLSLREQKLLRLKGVAFDSIQGTSEDYHERAD